MRKVVLLRSASSSKIAFYGTKAFGWPTYYELKLMIQETSRKKS